MASGTDIASVLAELRRHGRERWRRERRRDDGNDAAGRTARVTFNYVAEQEDELSLEVGAIIRNIKDVETGWCQGELNGKTGLFPNNFVEEVDITPDVDPASHSDEGKPKQEKDEVAKHPFSEPWDDSDLILVVEEKKFHVHRQIMSIHSPVFKAMLKTVGCKEATTATEIPLPGKKADEFLDFLKLLYLKGKEGIELNKMSHILRLADEYQAEGVHDCCGKALRDMSKSKENVVQIFALATQTATAREDSRLDNVRFQCRQIVKDMELGDIQGSSGLKNLNGEASVSLLGERIGRLETFVRQIYPQFIGLVEYSLCLGLLEISGSERCRVHFGGDYTPSNWKQKVQSMKVNTGLPERINECSVCRQMILEMVKLSHTLSFSRGAPRSGPVPQGHVYGGEYHFDSDVIPIVNDFKKVMSSLAPISCVMEI